MISKYALAHLHWPVTHLSPVGGIRQRTWRLWIHNVPVDLGIFRRPGRVQLSPKFQHKMPWKSLKILESLLSLLSLTSLAVPKCLGCSFPVLDVLTHFKNFNSFFSSKLSSWNAASDIAYDMGPGSQKGQEWRGVPMSSNEFQWVPCWPMPNNSDRCWLCRLLRLPIVRRFLRTFGSSNCSAAARQHRDMSAAKALWSSKLPMQAWTGRQEKTLSENLKVLKSKEIVQYDPG